MIEKGEQLTCGAYDPSGKNIAIGTTFGSIFFCQHGPSRAGGSNFRSYRVDRISKTTENAVTSIAMTKFQPEGTILVAFDNGIVRVWQTTIREDLRN